ncbi:MAG: hypothetical protein ACLUHE_00155 [Christensenellales bacterium]
MSGLRQSAQDAGGGELENGDVPPGFSLLQARSGDTLSAQVAPLSAGSQPQRSIWGRGRDYPRAGNGKAAVGTNGWVQVFGQYEGWLLIQYHIDRQSVPHWLDRTTTRCRRATKVRAAEN